MNAAYLSALSALAGSAIGAFASLVTTWITQHHQSAQLRLANESSRRERLFGDFIDQASSLYGDSMVNHLNDPAKLVMLYATLSKLRLFAAETTIAAAAETLETIVHTYRSPNIDFSDENVEERAETDILRSFTEAARRELLR